MGMHVYVLISNYFQLCDLLIDQIVLVSLCMNYEGENHSSFVFVFVFVFNVTSCHVHIVKTPLNMLLICKS